MASAKRTLKIEVIRAVENFMFWLDRLTMFLILSFSCNPRCGFGFLNFAVAACLFVFTHYNYILLYVERRRIYHPHSDEADAKFNKIAFYGERVGFLVMILWLAFGWPSAFEMTLFLNIFINGLYMLQYQKLQEEKYAYMQSYENADEFPQGEEEYDDSDFDYDDEEENGGNDDDNDGDEYEDVDDDVDDDDGSEYSKKVVRKLIKNMLKTYLSFQAQLQEIKTQVVQNFKESRRDWSESKKHLTAELDAAMRSLDSYEEAYEDKIKEKNSPIADRDDANASIEKLTGNF